MDQGTEQAAGGRSPDCRGQRLWSWRALGSRSELARGTTLFWQGGTSDCVFVLERGLVGLQRLSAAGDAVGVYLVRPGEVFGEEVLFERPFQCFAETLAPSVLLRAPVRQVRTLLRQRPEEAWALAAQLQARTAELMQQMESLVTQDVRSRLARTLLALAETFGRREGAALSLRLPVTQAKLASLVGSTRQTVNTLLGALQAEGLIARSGRELRIPRPEALGALTAARPDRARAAASARRSPVEGRAEASPGSRTVAV